MRVGMARGKWREVSRVFCDTDISLRLKANIYEPVVRSERQ